MPELSKAARDLLLAIYGGAKLHHGYDTMREPRMTVWWLDGQRIVDAIPQELNDAGFLQRKPLGEVTLAKYDGKGNLVPLSPEGQAAAERLTPL